MDPMGLKHSERLFIILLFLGMIVGVWRSAFNDDASQLIQTYAIFALLGCIFCVPNWPFFNRHPIAWSRVASHPSTTAPAQGETIDDTPLQPDHVSG